MAETDALAFSYVRFSSKGQVGNDSERRQIEQAEEYARALGLTLAPPMRDLGISAFKGKNAANGSALGKFYEGVESGQIPRGSHLIVEAVDRLSREPPLKILTRLSALVEAGIIIHILGTKTVVTSEAINESPGLLNGIVWAAQIAHSESKQKSNRISQANENRRRQARAGLKLKGPLGPAWVNSVVASDGTVRLVLNEAANAIRMIFELACTGMGAPTITRRLNQAGLPLVRAYASAEKNAQRKLWYPAYVGRIITDRRAFGEYQPGKQAANGTYQPDGEPIPNYFPAVVTPEVWLKAHAVRSPKLGRKTGGRKATFSNLFTNGLAVCSCGARMVMRSDGGSKAKPGKPAQPNRDYLVCSNALHAGGCENRRTVGYNRFEQRVLDALPAIPWSTLVQSEAPNPTIAGIEAEIARAEVEFQRVERAKARVMTLIESNDDSPIPMLLESVKRLDGEEKAATFKLREAREALVLAKAQAVTDPHLTDELGVLRAALAEPTADLLLIRQKMHVMLTRVIKFAEFDKEASNIHVAVRGGYCIEVPRGRTGDVHVYLTMYHPNARKQDADLDLPPMFVDFGNPTKLSKPNPEEKLTGRPF